MDHIIEPKFWTSPEKRKWMTTLFFGTVALYASRMAMPITIASIAQKSEWSKTDSGTVLSCFFWGYMISQVFGGYLADNLGGEIVLLISVTGWSLVTFFTPELVLSFYSSSKALWLTSIGRILFGALQGVHFPAMASIISRNLHSSEKTFFSSVIGAGPAFGMLLSGSIGSLILDKYGWSYVHRTAGILGFTWVIFIRYYILDKESVESKRPKNSKVKFEPVPWSTFFKSPAFWSVLIAHFCHNNCFFVLISWLPSYFQEKFPGEKGWVFNFVPWIITPFTSIGGGWYSERLITQGWETVKVRRLAETISGLSMSILIAAFAFLSNFGVSLLCLAMTTAAGSLHGCGVFMNVHDIAPQYAGSVLGIINAVGAIPGFVGVYISGYILERWKSWTAVFLFTSFVNIFGCITFIVFARGKPIIPINNRLVKI